MSETTFEKISIGDRVWSCKYGYGIVMSNNDRSVEGYPLKVKNDTYVNLFYYTIDGRLPSDSIGRDLYWDKFDIPKRPLKKVKKKVYIGIIKTSLQDIKYTSYHTTDAFDDIKKLSRFMKLDNREIITAEIDIEQ